MNRLATVFLLALGVLVGPRALSVSAQQSPDTVSPRSGALMPMHNGPAGSMPHGMVMQRFDRSIARRIEDLHSKLRITPAQEEQWGKVAEIMRQNAAEMEALVKNSATAGGAVDQLKRYESMAETHLDGLKKFVPAFASLYDSLSSEQRAIADSLFRGRMGPPDRRPG